MTFFVEKTLALGPIRFGVSPRQAADKIDQDDSLSTGASGEFVRQNQCELVSFATPTARESIATVRKEDSVFLVRVYEN